MKILLFIALTTMAWAQQPASINASWGSWNGDYLSAVTQLDGGIPLPWERWTLALHLRAYGSWYFFSPNTWDTGIRIGYELPLGDSAFHLRAGVGAEIQWRLHKDERSRAETTWAPLLFLQPGITWENFEFGLPGSLYIYGDGVMGRLEAHVAYRWNPVSAHLRAEWDGLWLIGTNLTEGRFRSFIGAGWLCSP